MANINELKKYHIIYKTTNIKNDKYYLGMHSTNNINDGYIGSGKRLWYSINKYGKENFKFEILEFLPDRNSLKMRESELVNEETMKDPNCMNLKSGGIGGFNQENKFINSRIANNKFLELMKDPIWRESQIKKQKEGSRKYFDTHNGIWLGKKHKSESIQKMKKSKNKGVNNPQFGTHWITNGTENKKQKKQEYLPEGWTLGRTIK